MVLEKLSINSHIDDLFQEISQRIVENERDQDTLDNIFQDRQRKQQDVMLVAQEIDELEAIQKERIKAELSSEEYDRFLKVSDSVKRAREEVEEAQTTCNEVQILVEQLQQEVAADEIKGKASMLYAKLSDLKSKSHAIQAELNRSDDPVKEQERLTEQIRAGNSATQALERQIEILEQRIDAASNIKSDVEGSLANLRSGTAAEMKKLFKKKHQLSQMLQDWADEESSQLAEIEKTTPQRAELEEEIKRLKDGIKRLPELGDQNVLESSNLGSNENAQKLQEDVTQILILEKKLNQEAEKLHEDIANRKADIQHYSDVQGARNDADEKRAALNIEREHLQQQRARFQKAVDQKTSKLQGVSTVLTASEEYKIASDLEKRYKSVSEQNLELSDAIEQKQVDATPLRNKVMQLEQDHQGWLQERLLSGMGVQVE